MNADGGGVTRVTNNEGEDQLPAFSPDGTQIAFQGARGGNFDIYTVNVDGSGEKRHTRTGRGEYAPAWSPDGRFLAYQGGRRGETTLYVLDVAKGGSTAISAGEPGQDYVADWRATALAPSPAPPAP